LETVALRSSDLEQYAILLVRVSLGLFFAISGANKLFVAGSTQTMYETLVGAKVPSPRLMTYFVSGVEFVGGSLLTVNGLIRKYGYRGTPAILEVVSANADLANDLSAAAHLIHGSSEDRFTIRLCPGHLTRDGVEGVDFEYGDLTTMLTLCQPQTLRCGNNRVDGEEVFIYFESWARVVGVPR